MTTIELSINKQYVPNWGLVEGVRELFQNAIDQEHMTNGENAMTWDYTDQNLTIGNKESCLTRDTLLFGSTSKSGEGAIGQFGEGYKLALLVLTRIGKPVTIYNNQLKEIWKPRFKVARKLNNAEMLVIDIDKSIWKRSSSNDLDIVIEGITADEWKELVKHNLNIRKKAYECIDTECGELLREPNLRGKLFVGGLFVAEKSSLHYGYNFNPGELKLNRDRDMIWDWDLYFATAKVLRGTSPLLMARAVKGQYLDAKYLTVRDYFKEDPTIEAAKVVAQGTKDEYGEDVILAKSQSEANILKVKYGANTNIAVVPEQIVDYCKASGVMAVPVERDEDAEDLTTKDKLVKWLDDYQSELSSSAVEDLLSIISAL